MSANDSSEDKKTKISYLELEKKFKSLKDIETKNESEIDSSSFIFDENDPFALIIADGSGAGNK